MSTTRYDVVVIGAGFFGANIAAFLARQNQRVLLLEKEPQILGRASFFNQARVHNGYHYPRSLATAWSSHQNYDRFMSDYGDCVYSGFEHIYAIPRDKSLTSSYQFAKLCDFIGLPYHDVDRETFKLFDPTRIERAFVVEEAAIDNAKLRARMLSDLEALPDLTLLCNADLDAMDISDGEVTLSINGGAQRFVTRRVFNVTYSGINRILRMIGQQPLAIKNELAEICMVRMPEPLRKFGFTVMDGNFFSCMPAPAHGCHSLSHVRYTPHASWNAAQAGWDVGSKTSAAAMESRFSYMKNDSALYVPGLAGVEYLYSTFEVKAVPIKNEFDDARPILFTVHEQSPQIVSVLGSKLDCIYEVDACLTNLDVNHDANSDSVCVS
ncbi:NAD(P)/FAD-dependent oxidoreductase [Paraburkholderia rhizosphaerae]|uniref:Glycine/D-amino acid oxidase-like deaminating enzyme n=1 Tax=Paraburkholderia rhizosphaerae TaxID=480658 RepID=A0A4R8LLC9_9BURK|nr:FAD-dependent oxidoreductase [Paraburkholderia rhizosphaerae]TDY43320.1 glycine/D-amino acid oxidase-like deaminating enzyme [Paraburkholderia rhizosphaerae]